MPGRGRPRMFDAEQALAKAGAIFWCKGFSATSLDDVAGAMALNRPSIYAAFGDKATLYRAALAQFCGHMRSAAAHTLDGRQTVRRELEAFFRAALDTYFADTPPRGCMLVCTAPAEALNDTSLRDVYAAVIDELDLLLANRLALAVEAGELPRQTDTRTTAQLLHALLQSVALRARGGTSRRRLSRLVSKSLDVLLAGPP
ncbi:MAG: TetR/AcrR family transcriptional regulator [Pseudomonadales bacterium]